MESKLLHNYKNGDFDCSIYSDGTLIRESNIEDPVPLFCEALDLKILDYCNLPCVAYCHEKSGPNGKMGDLNAAFDRLSCLPAGIELALGGGATQKHPDLIPFLTRCKAKGWIPNITINQYHLRPDGALIHKLIEDKLIYGLGVSYQPKGREVLFEFNYPNTVFHLIAGVHSIDDLEWLCNNFNNPKVLILGFKQFGNGVDYYSPEVENCINEWRIYIRKSFDKAILSFDNLGLTQLSVRRFFMDKDWDRMYMGDDGSFTMYVDAVEQTYAVSSTSIRQPWESNNIDTWFNHVRQLSNNLN